MAWHGYARITVTTLLTNPQKVAIRNALLGLGEQVGAPNLITHLRPSNDQQSVIVEINKPSDLTKAECVTALATALGVSENTVNNNSTFEAFTGADWEARRQSCLAYLATNAGAWE